MKQKFLSACLVLACGATVLNALAVEDGYQPLLNPVAGMVDFGTVQTGSRSVSQSVIVSNRGAGPVTYTGYSLSQVSPGAVFAVTPQGSGTDAACAAGAVMAAGASCGLAVSFAPAAGAAGAGSKTALLTPAFQATAPTGKGTVAGNSPGARLIGSGSLPSGSVGPLQLTFGLSATGKDAAPQFLTLSNTGVGPLGYVAARLDSYDARLGKFALSAAANGAIPACNPSLALAPDTSCSVRVDFHSYAVGTTTAHLHLDLAGGAQAPAVVSLSGQTVLPQRTPRRN